MSSLEKIQRWLQEAIVDGPIVPVSEVIESSSRQSAEERLEVYRNAYTARLIECLEEEFEGVQEAFGESAFWQLGVEYLARYPSMSYTLADLGRNFDLFLRETRPACEGDEPDWGDFLIDLARLERTYAEVFDGPGSEERGQAFEYNRERFSSSNNRIVLCPSVRILELSFPVHRYHSEKRRGESPEIPEAQMTRLVIYRREYVVRREEIDATQQRILESLLVDGNLERAIEQGCAGANPEEVESRIGGWFEGWTRCGIVVGVAAAD